MQIHHLNCGSMRPRYPHLRSLVYCLLIESNEGLVLVDTGFGTRDYSTPSFMMKVLISLLRVPGDVKETAVEQVRALGFDPADVKHIVLTHLHLDHAGGLPDFPDAQIHVYRPEYDAMVHHRGLLSWGCEKAHFRHNPRWVFYDDGGDTWYGYACIKVIEGLKPAMRLIPLPGHTRGHCGVAVATEKGWLLHCGDAVAAYNQHTDMHDRPSELHKMPLIPAWFTRWLIGPHVAGLRNLRKNFGDQIEFISAHDIYSFESYQESGEKSPLL